MMVSKLIVENLAPNFDFKLGDEQSTFHLWLGIEWGILYSQFDDFYPIIATNEISEVGKEFGIPNLRIIGYTNHQIDDFGFFVVRDNNHRISNSYSNSPEERVIYLIDENKRVKFAFAKYRVNGITKFSSTHPSGSKFDFLIEKIFGKIWM